MSKKKAGKILKALLPLLVLIIIYIVIQQSPAEEPAPTVAPTPTTSQTLISPTPSPESSPDPSEDAVQNDSIDSVPEFSGEAYCIINGNIPSFTEEEITTKAFEYFSPLDDLGRCGVTMACVGQELMPTEPRESISHVKPSGWVNVPYSFVDGEYLYNRCHLIGFQLTGENANELNLITGTRYVNVEGMLPFENMVADYVKETGNHVLYRVTPIFTDDELVARGVQMEAYSVEDEGDGICFNVYCYNVQPGVIIDYATGQSCIDEDAFAEGEVNDYVLNTNSKKFHLPSCSGANSMSEKNRQEFSGSRELLLIQGFEPCSQCQP